LGKIATSKEQVKGKKSKEMTKKTKEKSILDQIKVGLPQRSGIIIGCMSGTSLDGIDLIACRFEITERGLKVSSSKGKTLPYPKPWKKRLAESLNLNAAELLALDADYGNFLGESIKSYLEKNKLKAQIIASHGHTVHHNPARGFSLQIGHGAQIWMACGLPVVNDFRVMDIAAGGQGAPLVPMGDALLYADYDQCINLGGIANTSYRKNGLRLAYDIVPFNLVMNALAERDGKEYDDSGRLAGAGKTIPNLLKALNSLSYYKKSGPKSMGREWVEANILPLLENRSIKTEDYLKTFVIHTVEQITRSIESGGNGKVLLSGGGAFNTYFVKQLMSKSKAQIVVANKENIQFKEAIIFALLGWLRWNNLPNCMGSVTGARNDVSGGVVWGGDGN
jgi:anhydro-N-acetylmuramic acid kinase